jgi:hypothetical protein
LGDSGRDDLGGSTGADHLDGGDGTTSGGPEREIGGQSAVAVHAERSEPVGTWSTVGKLGADSVDAVGDDVPAPTAEQPVTAAISLQRVVAAVTEQKVATVTAVEPVITVAALDLVVERRPTHLSLPADDP